MKKILIFLLITPLFIIQEINVLSDNIVFNISNFKAKSSGTGYDLSFNINNSGTRKEFFDDSRVVLSAEKYLISGIADNGIIQEKDFLFSRLSFDLDGDGKTESNIKFSSREGSLYINNKKTEQISSKINYGDYLISDFLENGTIKSYKLNKAGESFILYSYDYNKNFLTFGIGDKQNPITAEYFQNPCVEIIIAQETNSFLKTPSCLINGKSVKTRFSNELIFIGQEWFVSESWTAIPFQPGKSGKEPMQINISNINKPFAVILSIKFSLKEGTTLSTKRLINIID